MLEDVGLIVEYGSRGGGLTGQHKKNYISSGADIYIVAHNNKKAADGMLEFTCNAEVTCETFRHRVRATETASTSSSSTPRCPTPVITDVPYEGSQRVLPDNVVRFAIQR